MKNGNVFASKNEENALVGISLHRNRCNMGRYLLPKLWWSLVLASLLFSFGCKQANNGNKNPPAPTPSADVVITVKGDDGITVKSPNTFKVKANSTWKDAKEIAKTHITLKDNKEIKEWKLNNAQGAVLVDADKFEKDVAIFAISKNKDAPLPPTNSITITIEADEGYKFKDESSPCTIKVDKGVAWSSVKTRVDAKIELKEGYEKTGWKLGGKDGSYLEDAFVFNSDAKVFATSKKKDEPVTPKITITVRGDENIVIATPDNFTVDKGSRWEGIKTQAINIAKAKENFEIVEWHLKDETSEVLKDEKVFDEDATVFATSKRKVVTYKVEHLQENIENNDFTIKDVENKTGEAGKNTSAEAKTYDGFLAQSFAQSLIKEDGSTIVQIKYKRKETSLIIDLDGGETTTTLHNKDGKTLLKGKFGAKVEVKGLKKENHGFEKWEPALPEAFPEKDDTENTYTAKWTRDLVTITVQGDEGINLVSPNTTDVAKGAKWADIKSQVIVLATSKENFEIASWHLKDEAGEILKDEKVFNENAIVFATSKRKVVEYKVEHLQENIENDEYTTHETENKEGEAGKNTSAEAKTYEGFLAQSFAQSLIKADGSTVVQIKYKRKETSLIIDLDGGETATKLEYGTGWNKLLKGKYGASVSIETPTKDNHIFEKWEPALPSTFPKDDDTKNTYQAQWKKEIITITVQGDEGISLKGSGKVPVNKGSRWSEIKRKVEKEIAVDDNFQFQNWRLNSNSGKVLQYKDEFKMDVTVFATSKRKIVTYKVQHLQENIKNNDFTIKNIEKKEGEAGKNTSAEAKQYDGFLAQAFTQSLIKADGSTVVQIKYKRKITSLIIDLQEGETTTTLDNENGKTLLRGKFGARVEVNTPTKDSYKFDKWEPALPSTFPKDDDTENTYQAQWEEMVRITIKGDERVTVLEPMYIDVSSGKTFGEIKEDVEKKVELKREWDNGDYEIYDWKRNEYDGDEIKDDALMDGNITIYARTNYAKFRWRDNDPTTLIGCRGNDPKGRIIIPTKTTMIKDGAFFYCTELIALDCRGCNLLKKITCHNRDGSGYVDAQFYECKALKEINLTGCSELTEVSLRKANIKSINLSMCSKLKNIKFEYCKNLESVNLTGCSALTRVVNFNYCEALETINLTGCNEVTEVSLDSKALKSIDLSSCPKVTSVRLSETGIKSVDLSMCSKLKNIEFRYCKNLESVNLSGCSELKEINNGDHFHYYNDPFSGCKALKEINLTGCSALTKIDDSAFEDCEALKEVNLSMCSKVKKISFRNCGKLESVNLTGCSELTHVDLSETAITSIDLSTSPKIEKFNVTWCKNLKSVNLTGCSALKEIENDTFSVCEALETVNLTGCSALTKIANYAFGGREALKEVNLTRCSALTKIEYDAFEGCKALETVNLTGCSELTKVDLRRTAIKSIDLSMCSKVEKISFNNCENLKSVNLTMCSALEEIDEYSGFKDCIALETVNLTGCSALRKIGYYNFKNCKALETVNLSGCSRLSEVSLSETGIKSIDLSPCPKVTRISFSDCKNLESVNLRGCSELIYVNLSDTAITSIDLSPCPKVTSISFYDCTKLESMNLTGCNFLKKVILDNTAITSIDLSPCPNLTEVSLQKSGITSIDISPCPKVTEINFSDCENLESVNLRGCSELTYVGLSKTAIKSIDLSSCSKVKWINFADCKNLESVNLTGCSELTKVYLKGSPIKSIDLSSCSKVKWINFADCKNLENVDLSGCTALEKIGVDTYGTDTILPFSGCVKAVVKLPTSVTDIVRRAFGSGNDNYCKKVLVPNGTIKGLVKDSGYPEDRIEIY